ATRKVKATTVIRCCEYFTFVSSFVNEDCCPRKAEWQLQILTAEGAERRRGNEMRSYSWILCASLRSLRLSSRNSTSWLRLCRPSVLIIDVEMQKEAAKFRLVLT